MYILENMGNISNQRPLNFMLRVVRAKSIQQGFSLVELMIVIAIIGILTAIVLPSYQGYILRANRSPAQSLMTEIAGRQGQYLLDNRSYATSLTALNVTTPSDVSANYTISIATADGPPSFTLTATPVGKQVDDSCGTLTLDSVGAKTPTTGKCW